MTPTPSPTPSLENLQKLTFEYFWQAGSLPPPYHSEYTIRLAPDGLVELIFLPDYDSPETPRWVETRQATPEQIAALQALVGQVGLFDHPWSTPAAPLAIGGPTQSLRLSDGQRSASIPEALSAQDSQRLQPLLAAIQALLPAETWQKLKTQQEQYIRSKIN